MKQVLLISSRTEEYYYMPFVKACEETGKVKMFVFDPSCYPTELRVNVVLDGERITGELDVLDYSLSKKTKETIRIEEINTAWYLRADSPIPKKSASELEARFARNESISALDSIFSIVPCSWINRKETIKFLENKKLYQLMVAQRCGLKIPTTIVGNNEEEVIKFALAKNILLLKTLGYTCLSSTKNYFIYSQIFSSNELITRRKSIRQCPIFSQEYIEKLYEYRVMVIGSKILACRIDSQASEKTKIDWRHYDFDKVEHLQVSLPIEIEEKLFAFMKMSDLKYGAIDLILTPNGDFVFLEVNPSGQWGWLYDIARLPVPYTVSIMLEET